MSEPTIDSDATRHHVRSEGTFDSPAGAPAGYEILGEIARGGMGIVYRARQISAGRIVALKVVRPDCADEARFRREAEAIARLDHPNILPIYQVGEWESGEVRIPFFSMKCVEGGSLDTRLDRFRDFPRDAARLVATLARAVHHAHQRGILHRDLKPGNVLLDESGTAYVTDFGLARPLHGGSSDAPSGTTSGETSSLTLAGSIVGTPSYMAPEQASGDPNITTAADVYGLGAVLYALLTGRPPFAGDTAFDTIRLVLSEAPTPPRASNVGVDRDLEAICLSCLAKDDSRRPESALALAEDLEHWLAGRPTAARPAGIVRRLAMWSRRNPLVATLTLAVCLVLGIGLTAAGWQWRETIRARDAALRASEERDHNLYLATLALAERERQAGDAPVMHRLLQRCREDHRGWEWHCLARMADGSPRRFTDHQAPVLCVTVEPKNRWIASAGDDGLIRLRHADTGKSLAEIVLEPGEQVYALAFLDDGKRLAGASQRKMVKVWDVNTKKVVRQLKHDDVVVSLAVSRDGKQLASCSDDRTIKVWDALEGETPRLTLRGHADYANTVAFSPDGRFLVSGSEDRTVRIWSLEDGRLIDSMASPDGLVWNVAWHPKGKLLALVGRGHSVHLWSFDAERGRLAAVGQLAGHTSFLNVVAFSPSGDRLVSAGLDRTIRVWGMHEGEWIEYLALTAHRDAINSLVFDGDRLLSASDDHTLAVWNEDRPDSSRRPERTIEVGDIAIALAFAPNSRLLAATGGGGRIRLWDLASDAEPRILPGHRTTGTSLAFSGDGRWLLSGSNDKTVVVWEVATGKPITTYSGHGDRVIGVAFHPDGKRAASSSWDGTAHLWDVQTGKNLRVFGGHRGWVQSLTFSPDGKQLVTTGYDSTVRMHDVETGKLLATFPGHQFRVFTAAFHPDGTKLATGAGDGRVRAWASTKPALLGERGKSPGELLEGHTKRVLKVAFSPDGMLLASAGEDRTVRLWYAVDLTSLVEVIQGHDGPVSCVCFTSDSKVLATSSDDGKVRIWAVPQPPFWKERAEP